MRTIDLDGYQPLAFSVGSADDLTSTNCRRNDSEATERWTERQSIRDEPMSTFTHSVNDVYALRSSLRLGSKSTESLALGTKSTESLAEDKGHRVFKHRVHMLERLDDLYSLPFDLEEQLQEAIPGKYKNRQVKGRILQYAIFSCYHASDSVREEAKSVHMLLEARASPHSTFQSVVGKSIAEMQAVHLAAGLGYVEALLALINNGANVNAWAVFIDNKDGTETRAKHYQPIHEACFHGQHQIVQHLLTLEADVSKPNKSGLLPIHLAAWAGSGECVEHVVSCHQFAAEMLTKKGKMWVENEAKYHTPLEIATVHDKFPDEKLLLLGAFKLGKGGFFQAMRRMVRRQHHRSALKVMDSIQALEDPAEKEKIIKFIRLEAMRNKGRYNGESGASLVPCIVELIDKAPKVARKILQLLQDRPHCNHNVSLKHPIPTRALLISNDPIDSCFRLRSEMITAYESDYNTLNSPYHEQMMKEMPDSFRMGPSRTIGVPAWKYDGEKNEIPQWHREFAPRKNPDTEDIDDEVEVTVLCLPNFVDLRVVHVLQQSGDLDLFAVKSVQGICQEMWRCVTMAFMLDMLYEVIVLSLLMDRALRIQEHDVRVPPKKDLSLIYRSVSYSIFAAHGIRELTKWAFTKINANQYKVHHRKRTTWLRFLHSHLMDGFYRVGPILAILLYICCAAIDPMIKLSESFESEITTSDKKAEWTGSPSQFFLCVSLLWRWYKVIAMLCNVRGLGVTILTCTHSLRPMLDMYLVGFLLYCAFSSSLLSIRGPVAARDVLKNFFSAIVRSDTNMFPFLESLDLTLFSGLLSQATMMLAAFAFTLCYLNLIIGVYCSLYANIHAKSSQIWLRSRLMTSYLYLLEPVCWEVESRRKLWITCGSLFSAWFVTVWLCPKELAVLISPVLAAAQLILQALIVEADHVNFDIKFNGFEQDVDEDHAEEEGFRIDLSRSVSHDEDVHIDPEKPQRCLWMCHRADFDEEFFEHTADELRRTVTGNNTMLRDMRKEIDSLKRCLSNRNTGCVKFGRAQTQGFS